MKKDILKQIEILELKKNKIIMGLIEERTNLELNIINAMCCCTNNQLIELNKIVNDYGNTNKLQDNLLEHNIFFEALIVKISNIYKPNEIDF